jgi:hypothetical protein
MHVTHLITGMLVGWIAAMTNWWVGSSFQEALWAYYLAGSLAVLVSMAITRLRLTLQSRNTPHGAATAGRKSYD